MSNETQKNRLGSANYLVFPKLIALLLYPFVIGISMFLGILGGWMAGVYGGFTSSDEFIQGLQTEFIPFHIAYAFIKTILFALLLATIPSFHGYYMKGGALEVGKASTVAFVWTSVAIILTNYIIKAISIDITHHRIFGPPPLTLPHKLHSGYNTVWF